MSGVEAQKNELGHLVDMANDIARNYSFHPDVAERVADHLTRFWAPSMRALISEHVQAGGEGLADSAIEAVKLLQS
jgi:formate dehydrogenase subunit delta